MQWTTVIDAGKNGLGMAREISVHVAAIITQFKVNLFTAHHTDTPGVVQYTGGVLNYCVMACLRLTP